MTVLNVKEDEKWNEGTSKGVEGERRWNKISSLSDKDTSPDSDRDRD